jgi:hypothetical protein
MYMDAMSFDSVDMKAMLIRQIRYADPQQGFTWVAVRKMVAVPTKRIGPALASWGGSLLSSVLTKHAEWVDDKTVQLEGLAVRVRRTVVDAGVFPDDEITAKLDKLIDDIAGAQRTIAPATSSLLQRNPRSRVGAALVKVSRSYDGMATAATLLRQIVTGDDWETDVGVQSTRLNAIRENIRKGETADIDSELLALAEESATGDEFAFDASWARGLAQPPKQD